MTHGLIQRAHAALTSGDALRRGRDFAVGHVLRRMQRGPRLRRYAGATVHCPLCESDLARICTLYRDQFQFCAERQRRFLQHDHVRLYGDDFPVRLREAGFAVEEATTESIAEAGEIARFGLTPGERLLLCRR
jgi:hypothetical protein